jgi:ElaB/YqjD/DUF883 family membrane-anchored ribosome-binding protein
MPENFGFNSSLWGFDKRNVRTYIKTLRSEYDQKLERKESVIKELEAKYDELAQKAGDISAKESELEKMKEQISAALIDATDRMDNLKRVTEENADKMIAEAQGYYDEKIQKADEYSDGRINEADAHYGKLMGSAEADSANILSNAIKKAEATSAEMLIAAENERSELEALVEKSREDLVRTKEAIIILREDVAGAVAQFDKNLLNMSMRADVESPVIDESGQ